MAVSKWEINKIGLIDFWYYDEEEFHFLEGRLLLRGSNGSGKSVTMQSFIPLLLDGNKASERLDPFGSKARRLENYLLEEGDDRQERTGYLYMEFKRKESDAYLTIGIGMRARRGKNLESWYFFITDGRRIGKDFLLYKKLEDKITLTKQELKNRLGEGGILAESQKEYMKLVNEQLFGYENADEYKELIDLLIQLRTPKLSKDFKPTVINEILSKSLQSLSEDDLRPMSEAIENMDNLKSRLESMKLSKKAADKINDIYQKYNQVLLFEKASQLNENGKQIQQSEKMIKENENKKKQWEEELRAEKGREEDLLRELADLEEKKKDLDENDATKLREKQKELEEVTAGIETQLKEKDKLLAQKKEKQLELEKNEKKKSEEKQLKEAEIISHLDNMDEYLDQVTFDEHEFLRKELTEALEEPYHFQPIKGQVDTLLSRVTEGVEVLRQEKKIAKEQDDSIYSLEEKEKELEQWEKNALLLEESQREVTEEFIEHLYQWNSKNRELILPEEEIRNIISFMNQFSINAEFNQIRDKIWKEKSQRAAELEKKTIFTAQQLKEAEKVVLDRQKELEEWCNKKDPEPPKEEAILKSRAALEKAEIPFYPFYKLIDFGDKMKEEEKDYLEEALLHMGLLDALIVPSNYREKVLGMDNGLRDKYLFGDVIKAPDNLFSTLNIDGEMNDIILYQEIVGILNGIGLTEGNTFIDKEGNFGLGILKGTITKEYKSKYIGVKARENYRQEMIAQLKVMLEAEEKAAEDLRGEKVKLEERIKELEGEYEAFPPAEDVKLAAKDYAEQSIKIEEKKAEILTVKEKLKAISQELNDIRIQAEKICRQVYLKANLELFIQVKTDLEGYRKEIYQLENYHLSYLHLAELLTSIQVQLENIQMDMDDILYDIGNMTRNIRKNQMEIDNCKEQLKLTNYDQIKAELDHCIDRLKKIPGQVRGAAAKQAELTSGLSYLEKEQAEKEERLNLVRAEYQQSEKGFLEEYKLGYVSGLMEVEAVEGIQIAKKILRVLAISEDKTGEDYGRALQERFYLNISELVEYNLTMKEIFVGEEYHKNMKRLDIQAKYQGKQISFTSLTENLAKDIAVQENLVNESDRELFEDILANTISKKIRYRIYKSEEWVNKMNLLMGSMNTSSGLTLSLKWKEKRAEQEEQLDTRELVYLLKKDADIMQEEEFKKLSNHFHSKVEEARRILSDTGNVQSFHAIMREVLDYRKWFEFQLYFQKTGMPKKEMTNNAFFTFSGGEKAMAMYVPLFSAVVAKYQGARSDAPRLVSLDEAFAGVDETNIRDMFRLMVEFDFEFIINSQILWGDYDTVPRLAIYQLLRPENAKFVSVIPYYWDGKQKQVVTDQEVFEG